MFSALFNSLNFLVGPIWELVIVVGGVLATVAVVFFKGQSHGKQGEQNKQLKREQATREENNEIIENARIARDDDKSDILRSDDPQNRANRRG